MSDGLSVLYAEDNPMDADLTRAHFARVAPEITLEVVHGGGEFLPRARARQHDVLLLDQRLPDMDGLEILQQLVQEQLPTPIVLVTGIGDSELAAQALRMGASDYVPKRAGYLDHLPAQLHEVAGRHRNRGPAGPLARPALRRVLLVEDDPADVALYGDYLAGAAPPLAIEIARSAEEALERLERDRTYDLILSDQRLPGRSGLELMQEVQRRGWRLPFIIVAGSGSEELVIAALKGGASDCLIKHERLPAELALRIDLAIDRHELSLANERAAAELASRQRMLAALRESEQQLNLALDAGAIGLWSLDVASRSVHFSARWKAQLGYADHEIGNHPREWESRCHPDDLPRVHAVTEGLLKNAAADHAVEYRLKHKDGTWRWFLLRADLALDATGRPVRLFGSQIDISGLKQQQAELTQASTRLRQLSRRLLEVQETERRHLARELHDEIGQMLTAAKIHLQSATLESSPTRAAAPLQESVRLLDRLLAQVRSLSLDLRPPLLDDLGLGPALHWLIQQHESRASTPQVRLESGTLPGRFDPTLETACFRIAQEAFTNALRHARARRIVITIGPAGDRLRLTVTDDGAGFDPDLARSRAERGASLGLLGMHERTALAGGNLTLHSQPGQGTRVEADFPLPYFIPAP
jgi:PAS domain S-box-containing protein